MKSSEEQAVCVFDVCGTLYSANTTSGFLSYHHAAGHRLAKGLACRAISSRLSPFRYLSYMAGKAVGTDLGRAALIATLKGEPMTEIADSARDYARIELARAPVAHSHRLLMAHKAAGERIILMSNSIEPVIRAIAELFGIEYVASTLANDGRVYTGRIARDLTGCKHVELESILSAYHRRPCVHVVTDNGSDRALLEAADVRTVICSRGRRDKAFRGLEADYVDVA